MAYDVVVTIRHNGDASQTVTDQIDKADTREAKNALLNLLNGIASGARDGYMTININSGNYSATYALNGTAAGPTTTLTITTDEVEASITAELGYDATEDAEFVKAFARYVAGLGINRSAKVVLSGTGTQTWLFGRAA